MMLTIVEIAKSLDQHETSVRRRSLKENWPFDETTGRGGKIKRFKLEHLPQDVQLAIFTPKTIETLLPPTQAATQESGGPKPEPPLVSEEARKKALYKADLLCKYKRALDKAGWGNRQNARFEFEKAYNSGVAWPNLYKELGHVTWKTLESWSVKVKKHNNDCFFLADKRGSHRRGASGLTDEQTTILLRCALRPNKPRIAEAIRQTRAVLNQTGIEHTQSDATYRRWLLNWKAQNYGVWVWAREGATAWNDKCASYIERDINLLQVGDVIVADGHNLNFEIINPWTGKPKNHMTLILFYDMRSNMPLGWEIMPTENTAAISSALRRAVLRLGKYPKVVYLDNGRAFKSRFFQGSQSFDEAGYTGLYQRMGCQTIYAWPYHGQSKTVERFFGTFAELERMSPTYTGTSIDNKPPRMLRGEKQHRRLHEQQYKGRCLTLAEAHTVIAAWFDAYAKRPQRGHLNGSCPMDVFLEGRGQGVNREELIWLMMHIEIKTLQRNGITFQGQNYYHPALTNRRHKVTIRYDLQDTSSIWVMDQHGELLCEATPVEKQHPAAAQLGNETDRERLRLHIEQKRRLEKEASSSAMALLRNEVLPEHRRQMAELGVMENGQMIEAPKHKLISLDAEKLRREVEEATKWQEEAEAKDFRDDLLALDDSDRMERLLELEAQGVALGSEWTGFMSFFEQTPAYTDHLEFWEGRKMAFSLMWKNPHGESVRI